jgi:hypothetical protein
LEPASASLPPFFPA